MAGDENREPLMSEQKFKFSYKLMLDQENLPKIMQRARAGIILAILHPVWLSESVLTQDTSTASTDIYFDTTNRDFEADGYMMLIRNDGDIAETFTIDTVYADHDFYN
jgi:hypothetical protein